jgi:hypothetical protein
VNRAPAYLNAIERLRNQLESEKHWIAECLRD